MPRRAKKPAAQRPAAKRLKCPFEDPELRKQFKRAFYRAARQMELENESPESKSKRKDKRWKVDLKIQITEDEGHFLVTTTRSSKKLKKSVVRAIDAFNVYTDGPAQMAIDARNRWLKAAEEGSTIGGALGEQGIIQISDWLAKKSANELRPKTFNVA